MNRILLSNGSTALSVSLSKPGLFYAAVAPSGVTGGVITVSGAGANAGSRIAAATVPLYVEVLTDGRRETSPGIFQTLPVAGHRFEVDKAATVVSGNARITLTAGSATNTVWPPPDLSGAKLVIRGHTTIGDIFGGPGNILLHGTGLASASDRISFYDNAAGQFRTYWFRRNAAGTVAQWRSLDESDPADYTGAPIPPGVGVILHRQPSAGPVTLTHIGQLRETPFRLPLPAGYSLTSHSRPLDHSPAMARMFRSRGWVGSSSPSSSDRILLWNGGGYAAYWFRAESGGAIQQWRSTAAGDTADYMNDTGLLHGDRAPLIHKLTADPGYLMDLQPGGAPAPSP